MVQLGVFAFPLLIDIGDCHDLAGAARLAIARELLAESAAAGPDADYAQVDFIVGPDYATGGLGRFSEYGAASAEGGAHGGRVLYKLPAINVFRHIAVFPISFTFIWEPCWPGCSRSPDAPVRPLFLKAHFTPGREGKERPRRQDA
jgi:hypothetical protein